MKIGITYNLKNEMIPGTILDKEYTEEFDSISTVEAICDVFAGAGHETIKLGGSIEVADRLRAEKVDFVFNIAEGHIGRNREGHIPAILEMLETPYSGADPLTLSLTLDKALAKKMAARAGLPVPAYRVIHSISELLEKETNLTYPVITKPAWEGSSKGIYNSSKAHNKKDMEESVRLLLNKYPGQPVIIEEFIRGREITIGVIGNSPAQVLGLMEITDRNSPNADFFYSLDVKRNWKEIVEYTSPPDISRILDKHLRYYALLAFREFGCRDVARIDFRISEGGRIYLLEINPLPGLSPDYGDLVIMARKNGVPYEDLVMSILNHALSRYELHKKPHNIIGVPIL